VLGEERRSAKQQRPPAVAAIEQHDAIRPLVGEGGGELALVLTVGPLVESSGLKSDDASESRELGPHPDDHTGQDVDRPRDIAVLIALLLMALPTAPTISTAYRQAGRRSVGVVLVRKEVAMVPVIVLGVIVWLSIPPLLSRAMARRGYDRGAYQIVAVLFGPVALVFAAVDLVFDQRQPPRILQHGRPGHGDLAVLVVIDGSSKTFPSTTALAGLGSPIGRLGLAEVLPKGGPLLDERRAAGELQQVAVGLGEPELALLFGRPDEAISDHATARGYDVVITPHPDPVLSARLRATGRTHCWGDVVLREVIAQITVSGGGGPDG
jgi:hypothetical protein